MTNMLPPLSDDTLGKLRHVSTATLTSQLIKLAGLRTRSPLNIKPLNMAKSRFVGPAVTLRYGPLREDLRNPWPIWRPRRTRRAAPSRNRPPAASS